MIFDEFARVLETSPDFLKELVNVAAKGRSIGMHLVLATQALQGKLSPELKNNITLRISLRQNEPAESTEVLVRPRRRRHPRRAARSRHDPVDGGREQETPRVPVRVPRQPPARRRRRLAWPSGPLSGPTSARLARRP